MADILYLKSIGKNLEKNSSCFKIVEPTPRIAGKAELFHTEKRKEMPQFGIVDSLVIATSKKLKATIVALDMHCHKTLRVLTSG